jgi:hypothetical protein
MQTMFLLQARRPLDDGADREPQAPFEAARAQRVLRARGRHDLAARLEDALPPTESAALASALLRYVDKETRTTFFRSYRKVLPDDEAQTLLQLACWLLRAAQAGCRVTGAHAVPGPVALADDSAMPAPRSLVRPSPLPIRAPRREDQCTRDEEDAGGIMPPWLNAPEHSVWSDGPPAPPIP